MAKTYKAPFTQAGNFTPVLWGTGASDGNTTTSGTSGNFSAAFVTGGSETTRVSRIVFRASGTVTANRILVWYDNGTTKYCIGSLLIPATTPSATVLPIEGQVVFPEAYLVPSSHTLKFTVYNNSEGFFAIPSAADY